MYADYTYSGVRISLITLALDCWVYVVHSEWGIIAGLPIAKRQNKKNPMTNHEIMLHAMSLNLPALLTAFTVQCLRQRDVTV